MTLKIELLSYTQINPNVSDIVNCIDGELLVEYLTRHCYGMSSVNKMTYDKDKNYKFIQKLFNSKHDGIGEHFSMTFRINNLSLTAFKQLSRYRAGVSFLCQSGRYTEMHDNELWYITPKMIKEFGIKNDKKINTPFEFSNIHCSNMEQLFDMISSIEFAAYKWFMENGIKKEDARMILNQGMFIKTFIMTVNVRSLRHILLQRLDEDAQWEIRNMAKYIYYIVKTEWPIFVEDIPKRIHEEKFNKQVLKFLCENTSTNSIDDNVVTKIATAYNILKEKIKEI